MRGVIEERAKKMRRRSRLGYAAAVAVLVLAGFGSFRLYEALQPTPDVVTTAENLPGNSTAGSASGETGSGSTESTVFPGSEAALIAEGWVQAYDMTEDYVLFGARAPEDKGEDTAYHRLLLYSIASGTTELLTEQVGGTSVLVLRGSLLLTENV